MWKLLLLLSLLPASNTAPISNPHVDDSHIHKIIPDYFVANAATDKKYYNNSPIAIPKGIKVVHDGEHTSCNIDIHAQWIASVGSPAYAAPVIFPSAKDGNKQIYLTTFYRFIELLESDGYKHFGWPLGFEESSFRGSPVIYDVDGDGNADIGVIDKNANIYW